MAENTKKLRWGILGTARINRRFIPALKAAKHAELFAIASRTEEKGKALAKQWDIPHCYTGYETLLNNPDIDVVYIPLPNSLHVEWLIKAAKAGKQILCEKPIALSLDDIDRIEAIVSEHNTFLMEGFMYRFHPQQKRVRELIQNGTIGEIRVLRGTFAFVLATDGYNIRLDSKVGGGATWDVGCYGVNVARWMFGMEPKHVYAEATVEVGVDRNVAAILDFGGRKRAILDYGIDYGRRSMYEIIGTKGTISIENMWQEPDVPAYLYLRDQNGLKKEEFSKTNHFQLEIEAFQEALLAKKPSPYPLQDARFNIKACLAILRSIQEGKRQTLTPA